MARSTTEKRGAAPLPLQPGRRWSSAPVPRAKRRNFHINWKLLGGTLVLLAAAIPAAMFWHARQVENNAQALLTRADELEAKQEYAEAARWLHRYLRFRPDDSLVRVRLAEVFDRSDASYTGSLRAAELYQQALARLPDRRDLRVRSGELYLAVHRWTDAEGEADALLQADAADRDGLRLRALALHGRLPRHSDEMAPAVAAALEQALNADPGQVQLAGLLAGIYRDRLDTPAAPQRAEQADAVMARMAENQPDRAAAQLALYSYRVRYELPAADQALEAAREAAPDDLHVLSASVEDRLRLRQPDEALPYGRRLLEQFPKDPAGYLALGRAHLAAGRIPDALAVARDGLATVGPEEFTLNLLWAQSLLEDRQFDQAAATVDLLTELLERMGQRLTADGRARAQESIDTLRADLLVSRGDLLLAVPLLKRAALAQSKDDDAQRDAASRARSWRRLAAVYSRLENWDLAAAAYEEAAGLGVDAAQNRVAAAAAWEAAGRATLAVNQYREALKSGTPTPGSLILLARAELQQQLRNPGEPDWQPFQEALEQARAAGAADRDLLLLEVQAAAAQGRSAEAVELLDESLSAGDAATLQAAVLLYDAAGNRGRADQALAQWKAQPGQARAARLAEADMYVRRMEFDSARMLCEELLTDATGEERRRIDNRLATIEIETGRVAEARTRLLRLAEERPRDAWPLEQLADMALRQEDLADLARWERSLEKIEGPDGSLWRFFRGMRLVMEAQDSGDERFVEARRLQEELQSLRPAWPATFLVKGRIAQKQGDLEGAAEAYRRAIDLGISSVTVYEWLVTLLYEQDRWAEADDYLSRLQGAVKLSPKLAALAPHLLSQSGELTQVLAAARAAAEARPHDPLRQVWLGQTLALAWEAEPAADRRAALLAEAAAALETAIAQAPQDFRPYGGAVWFYNRTGQPEKARQALQGLSEHAQMTPLRKSLALAQGHQLLGDPEQAERHYLQAIQLAPKDARVQEQLALFYQQFNPEKSEGAYRRLLEIDPGSLSARRQLAALLSVRGTDHEFEQALELLGGDAFKPRDRRLQAMLLLQRGGAAHRKAARKLLAGLVTGAARVDATDRLLLARACEQDGDPAAAREQLAALAAAEAPAPAHLAAYLEFLLRQHFDAPEAQTALARLESLEPDKLRTVQLGALLRQAQGQSADQLAIEVETYRGRRLAAAADVGAKAAALGETARLYAALGLKQPAERTLQELAASGWTPQAHQPYVLWLLEEERAPEAVELCLAAWRRQPELANALLLAGAMTTAASQQPAAHPAADEALAEALETYQRDSRLLFDIGTLRYIQGELPQAAEMFEELLISTPRHAAALNNLALVLSEMPARRREALRCVERAQALVGRSPELRDTQALVLFNLGEAAQARAILLELLDEQDNHPRRWFHLAAAQEALGDKTAARDALRRAQQEGVARELLTPAERKLLSRLEKVLAPPARQQP